MIGNSYSNPIRPALRGVRGAVAAAHPLGASAAQEIFAIGGNAVDATIAAQAVIAVTMPDACGLGGDMLALVSDAMGGVIAVSGAGKSPMAMTEVTDTGASSVTVPGIVGAWDAMASRWGSLPLSASLAPALRLARNGFPMSPALYSAVEAQRHRLVAGGAAEWVFTRSKPGDLIVQPELAELLVNIGKYGAKAFYEGPAAQAIARAVQALGGALSESDLASHETETPSSIAVQLNGWELHVQPSPTQGVLFAMSAQGRVGLGDLEGAVNDHACIELTEAAFVHRSDCQRGAPLLDLPLEIDLAKAGKRGGPRAYLHTAGVSAADQSGLTTSTLVSVFDDFGSAVFVPALGIVLNNRGGGFTDGANAPAPGKRPVHTLAPAMLKGPNGTIGLATPGADGQVQTLLQVMNRCLWLGQSLDEAVAAPRWRSEGGKILFEKGHPSEDALRALGHDLQELKSGDSRFGAVVAAGCDATGTFAVSDWRRECWSGVA